MCRGLLASTSATKLLTCGNRCATLRVPLRPRDRAILDVMRLYLAGPLFSAAERDWNERLAAGLREAGHEVFLPQDNETGMDGATIFSTDVGGIDAADAVVANVDG